MTVVAELGSELVGDMTTKTMFLPLPTAPSEFIQHKRMNYKGGTGLEAFTNKVLSQALGKSVDSH